MYNCKCTANGEALEYFSRIFQCPIDRKNVNSFLHQWKHLSVNLNSMSGTQYILIAVNISNVMLFSLGFNFNFYNFNNSTSVFT